MTKKQLAELGPISEAIKEFGERRRKEHRRMSRKQLTELAIRVETPGVETPDSFTVADLITILEKFDPTAELFIAVGDELRTPAAIDMPHFTGCSERYVLIIPGDHQ